MNMAIRGIDANFGDHPEDTFFNDLHSTQKFDFIMANPPFNLSNWGQDKLQNDPRWAYGLPPAGNANYAWIEHMVYPLVHHPRQKADRQNPLHRCPQHGPHGRPQAP